MLQGERTNTTDQDQSQLIQHFSCVQGTHGPLEASCSPRWSSGIIMPSGTAAGLWSAVWVAGVRNPWLADMGTGRVEIQQGRGGRLVVLPPGLCCWHALLLCLVPPRPSEVRRPWGPWTAAACASHAEPWQHSASVCGCQPCTNPAERMGCRQGRLMLSCPLCCAAWVSVLCGCFTLSCVAQVPMTVYETAAAYASHAGNDTTLQGLAYDSANSCRCANC